MTGREAAAGQIQFFASPRRLGTSEEFAALAAHIVENGFFNAATPRLDAGYRIPCDVCLVIRRVGAGRERQPR